MLRRPAFLRHAQEILEIVNRQSPADACHELVQLAERRGTDDNISVQIIRVESVQALSYFRGQPIYHETEIPMPSEVEVGDILDNRFQIESVISRSGMASIFKAKDFKTGELVAVKVPFMRYESEPAFFTRFQREEEIGKSLNHPSLLKIYSLDDKSRPYMVMELLEGQTLRQILNTSSGSGRRGGRYRRQLCDALQHMHEQNVVHRDMKPENIMICDDGRV